MELIIVLHVFVFIKMCSLKINLSILYRTNDELVQFLKVQRKYNFVKTHGGDIKKSVKIYKTIE